MNATIRGIVYGTSHSYIILNFGSRYWDDLDEDQRQAATVLGYSKENWDKE